MHRTKTPLFILSVAAVIAISLTVFPFHSRTQAAQQNATGMMPNMTAPVSTIDGSRNPELIPDSEAYKLLFLSLSLEPSKPDDQVDAARRLAFVKQTGISDAEVAKVLTIMDEFRSQYETLTANYNAAATADAAKGIIEDLTHYGEDVDGLVSMTRLSLQGALQTDSLSKFQSHVQRLKRHIRMSQ